MMDRSVDPSAIAKPPKNQLHLGITPKPSAKWAYAAALAIALAMLIRPGDVPWIQDEPKLIAIAWDSNHTPSQFLGFDLPFTVTSHGVFGTRGITYGPLPAWFYQICLSYTRDPLLLVRIRTIFGAGVTLWGLFWLARAIGCNSWLAVLTLLSPWIWLYSRQLWDNTFCIPLAALAFGAYARFLGTQRISSLCIAIACCLAMPLAHLMSMALVIPMALHAIVFHWRDLLRHKWKVLSIIIAALFLSFDYMKYAWGRHAPHDLSDLSPIKGWLFPLLGARYMTATGLNPAICDGWETILGGAWRFLVPSAEIISAVAFPLSWLGIILAGRMIWRNPARREPMGATQHLALLALGVLVCQSFLDGIQRVYADPHYFNGTWIAYVFFVWLSMQRLAGNLPRAMATAGMTIYALALATVVSASICLLARDGGTRASGFGTVLSEQIRVAGEISQYDPASPRIDLIQQWQQYPYACEVLEMLIQTQDNPGPLRKLIVRYAGEEPDARLAVDVQPLSDDHK
jgi:hypothetical protein